MKKKSKKIEVPKSVTEFTDKEQSYLFECQKRFRFFIDIHACVIMVPPNEKLTDDEQLICEHLYNRFGIDVERSDSARVLKLSKVHSRELNKTIVKPMEAETVDIMSFVRVGLVFKDTRKGLTHKIFKDNKLKWECQVVDSMLPNWSMDKASFEVGVKSGLLVFDVPNPNQTKIQ